MSGINLDMDMLLNMPTPYMVLAACVVVSATLILGRLLANALPGKQPPILEGIPYIGGLLKFVKVSGGDPWAEHGKSAA